MRKLVALVIIALLAFLAWPLWTGWRLREAVKARDLAALEAHVDWTALRANLKPRVAEMLTEEAAKRGTVAIAARKMLGQAVTDKAVDVLVTPDWLARVLRGREFIVAKTAPARTPNPQPAPSPPPADSDPEDAADPLPPRRLRWAFFESPARFRVEAVHPRIPDSRIVAILGLTASGWRLVDVDIKRQPG